MDHFAPGAPDEEWLPEVAARGWVILRQDERMLRAPALRNAVLESGGALLILVGGSVPARVTAESFINTLDQMERFLQKHKPPFIAKVFRPSPGKMRSEPRPGRIELKFSRR
ncbi:MAG: hypothetical protein HYV63_10600 [Candidatus Schekmanbacteria bacterium]|nr:hypothetical protein [Candidatus Schekmanbacteria bacterium]